MTLSLATWHQRYLQQSRWTQQLRAYLYKRVRMENAVKVLEVGCGTGVLLEEIRRSFACSSHGLDINIEAIKFARKGASKSNFVHGDGCSLPYHTHTFDITFCHFLLLWVGDPLRVIMEMARVTKTNGYVLAMAEPDYGGRLDFPPKLARIGDWQIDALRGQGADPLIGRQLRGLFHEAGLKNVEAGVLGNQWSEIESDEDNRLEWEVICSDLQGNQEFMSEAEQLRSIDTAYRQAHQRILYVPTFYAFGMLPD